MKNKGDKIPGTGNKKENPFLVPDNYFESFPQRLGQRLQENKPAALTPVRKFPLEVKHQLAAAAAIAVLIVAGYFGVRNFVFQQDMRLTTEEIQGYIEYYNHEFRDLYFLGMIDHHEDFYLDESLYPADHDTYVDYLYNTDIDLDLIITEF
jgi:hypothetical protein